MPDNDYLGERDLPFIDADEDNLSREVQVATINDTTSWPIVCICGSMRFLPQMHKTAAKYTSDGYIVLMPYSISEGSDSNPDKIMLDAMHRGKIDLANFVVVVTNNLCYLGDSTRAEIAYAIECGKDVRFHKYPIPTPAPDPEPVEPTGA